LKTSKLINLNIFLLEKINHRSKSRAESILTSNKDQSNTINSEIIDKLGFYPSEINKKFPNANIFIQKIADSCLLFELYNNLIKEEPIASNIHIHFDENKAQAAVFIEGVMHEKFSGFNFQSDKALIENVENIVNFINKIAVIVFDVAVSVSKTNIDDK
jgi:hypothetical protein